MRFLGKLRHLEVVISQETGKGSSKTIVSLLTVVIVSALLTIEVISLSRCSPQTQGSSFFSAKDPSS